MAKNKANFIKKIDNILVNLYHQTVKAISKQDQAILGLTKSEAAIYQYVHQFSSVKVTAIAQATHIPRTTVHFLLKKLADRKIVRRIKVANHYEWQTADSNQMANLLKHLALSFDTRLEAASFNEAGFQVFTGKQRLEEAYELMLSNEDDRVFVIQGHHAIPPGMEQFSREFLRKIHEDFRKKGIILECIFGIDALKFFNEWSDAELRSHLDRRVILYLVPDQHVDHDFEVLIIRNIVALIHPATSTVSVFSNPTISIMMKGLFNLAKLQARKIDLNEYIRTLLAQREK